MIRIAKNSDLPQIIKVCKEALHRAILQVKPGGRLSDVSGAVQEYAETNGYSVVRKFVGHGIGSEMHESPQIPNFVARDFTEVILIALLPDDGNSYSFDRSSINETFKKPFSANLLAARVQDLLSQEEAYA